MHDKHKKKGLLGSGLALLQSAIIMLVEGQHVEGVLVSVVGVAFILAYDYYDDRMKGTPKLPDGVSTEDVQKLVSELSERIETKIETQNDSDNEQCVTEEL